MDLIFGLEQFLTESQLTKFSQIRRSNLSPPVVGDRLSKEIFFALGDGCNIDISAAVKIAVVTAEFEPEISPQVADCFFAAPAIGSINGGFGADVITGFVYCLMALPLNQVFIQALLPYRISRNFWIRNDKAVYQRPERCCRAIRSGRICLGSVHRDRYKNELI